MEYEETPEEIESEIQRFFSKYWSYAFEFMIDNHVEILQQIDVFDGCLTEIRPYDIDVDYVTETEYIARIKDTPYAVKISMISCGEEYAVCVSELDEADVYDFDEPAYSEPQALNLEMITTVEQQLIAMQNQDEQAFISLFDMDLIFRAVCADGHEDISMEEIEKMIKDLFDEGIDTISHFPDFSVSEGCLTDITLSDIYLDVATESDYTARIKDTDFLVDFGIYNYDNSYVMFITDIFSDQQEEPVLSDPPQQQDLFSAIEKQLIAIQNQDEQAFMSTFDMNLFVKLAQITNPDENYTMNDAEISIQELFDYANNAISTCPDFTVSENCLMDMHLINDETLFDDDTDTVIQHNYTCKIKDTSIFVDFSIVSSDDGSIASITDIYPDEDPETDETSIRLAYGAVMAYALQNDLDLLPEQIIDCADGSGEVSPGLGEMLIDAMKSVNPPGEVFISSAEIGGETQIFVQWRASADDANISQYPKLQSDHDTITWGNYTP